MKPGLRTRIAKKAGKYLIRAQEGDPPVPDVEDEGPAAPAPPAGDDDVDEEEIEDEVREDKEDEVELEELGEKLDELADTNETIVDALEDIKDVIEGDVLGDEEDKDVEDEFEELQDEDLEDEFTAEEFGINPDNLVVSKEDKMKVSGNLRKARKARLYHKQAAESYKDVGEAFGYDKAKNKKFKPTIPASPNTKVKGDPPPDMLKLAQIELQLDASKKKWVVLQNKAGKSRSICEIPITSAKGASKAAGIAILRAMKAHGIIKTLKKYKARKCAQEAPEGTPPNASDKPAVPPKGKPKVDKEVGLRDMERKFTRAFRLALTAMNKNLVANPLKESFAETLNAFGVTENEIVLAVESSFHKASMEHFETAIAETEKYLGLSDSAFIEVEATVGDMNVMTPKAAAVEENTRSDRAERLRIRASKGSLPLSTASETDPTDMAKVIQNALPRPRLSGVGKYLGK